MGEQGTNGRRPATRVWRAAAPATEPVAQVTDPALRAIMLARRRALKMELAEIERRCGVAPAAPDDEAA